MNFFLKQFCDIKSCSRDFFFNLLVKNLLEITIFVEKFVGKKCYPKKICVPKKDFVPKICCEKNVFQTIQPSNNFIFYNLSKKSHITILILKSRLVFFWRPRRPAVGDSQRSWRQVLTKQPLFLESPFLKHRTQSKKQERNVLQEQKESISNYINLFLSI